MPLAMLLLYVTTLTSPNSSVNGVKIVTRQITGSFTDMRTEYLAPDRLRNEWQSQMRDGSGPPMATIIQRGEHDRVFMLDLAAHEYITYETDSRGSTVAMRRPMVESGGTLKIIIENVDTGERKELFGHTARHIITREKRVAGPGACSKPSLSETDGWYIEGSVMPEWHQQKKNSFGVVLAAEISAGSNDKCFNKMDKIEVYRSGVETGFPVKITTTLTSEVTQPDGNPRTLSSTWGSEVVELKEGPLELTLFDVPKDFTRVESLRSWTAKPPRQLTGWEWFKERVQEMFK
ncbi:MAG TPA: hypothetical protein VGQ12_12970 [Candidatus Angelobacter sp.]|jgi:hypothetical protein|nr:hypothetical protein [Candidatus Angelobacter sp.]